MLHRGAKRFVGMQDDVVKMVLCARANRLVEIINIHRLRRQPDETGGIDRLRRIVCADHQPGIIGRCLVPTRAVRRLVPHLPIFDSPMRMANQLGHIFRPAGKIIHRQISPRVHRVPLGISRQDAAEPEMLIGQIIHLRVEIVPSPLPLLGLDRAPFRLRRALHRDSNRSHLRDPLCVSFRRAIPRRVAADAEGTERGGGVIRSRRHRRSYQGEQVNGGAHKEHGNLRKACPNIPPEERTGQHNRLSLPLTPPNAGC